MYVFSHKEKGISPRNGQMNKEIPEFNYNFFRYKLFYLGKFNFTKHYIEIYK